MDTFARLGSGSNTRKETEHPSVITSVGYITLCHFLSLSLSHAASFHPLQQSIPKDLIRTGEKRVRGLRFRGDWNFAPCVLCPRYQLLNVVDIFYLHSETGNLYNYCIHSCYLNNWKINVFFHLNFVYNMLFETHSTLLHFDVTHSTTFYNQLGGGLQVFST